MKSWWLFFYDN